MELTDFTQATLDFVEKYHDEKLAQRIHDALIKAVTGKDGMGNTKKTFCGLAFSVAAFLKMCSDLSPKDDPVTTEEFSEAFKETVDLFCYIFDNPDDEEEEDNVDYNNELPS